MRLIDADRMRLEWLMNGENEYIYDTNDFLNSIDDQPDVDAVPVVRCKNCRFSHAVLVSSPHLYYCRYNHKTVDEMDYCSKGENK